MRSSGIIMSGFVSIIAGIIVRYSGKNGVEKVLPATITGSIAMVIGLTLAGNAIGDAAPRNGPGCGCASHTGKRLGLGCVAGDATLHDRILTLSEGLFGTASVAAGRGGGLPDSGHHLLGRRGRI